MNGIIRFNPIALLIALIGILVATPVARAHYDPVQGRWMERDPIGYADGANLYEYVGGSPIGSTDPTGQYKETQEIPGVHNGQTGVWVSIYERGWFGGKHEHVSTTWVANTVQGKSRSSADDLLGAVEARNRNASGSIRRAAGHAKDALEMTQEAAVAAATVVTPGPDELLLAGVVAAKTSRLGSKCADAAAGGARVSGDALKAARAEFDRVRPQFWKNEAASNSGRYSAENVNRMKQGKPPIGSDGHPMELHHGTPLSEGGSNAFDNLFPMTREEHRLGPNFRKNHPNQ